MNTKQRGSDSNYSTSLRRNDFSRKMLTLSGRKNGLLPFHVRSMGNWKGLLGLKVYLDAPEAEPLAKKKRGSRIKKVATA